MRNLIRLFVLATLLGSSNVRAQEWTIDSVMAGLRGLRHVQATFVETRHSGFLTKQLKLKGVFIFKAPQTFIKETVEPFPERVQVDSNGVRIDQERSEQESQSRTQFIAADAHPLVKGLVDSAQATMSGRKELLESRYELNTSGTEQDWSVVLIPKEQVLREKVESITFLGSGDLIQRAEIKEADGDWSVIQLTYEKVERH